jgi:hypothetical protein
MCCRVSHRYSAMPQLPELFDCPSYAMKLTAGVECCHCSPLDQLGGLKLLCFVLRSCMAFYASPGRQTREIEHLTQSDLAGEFAVQGALDAPQIPQDLAWHRSQASVLGGRRLTDKRDSNCVVCRVDV